MSSLNLRTIIRKELSQIFFIVLSFGLMVVVSYYFVRRIEENRLFANAQEALDNVEAYIRSCLHDGEMNLLQSERLIENWLELGETPEGINSHLTALTETMNSDSAWAQNVMNIYGIINETLMPGIYPLPPLGEFTPQERPWYHAAEAAEGGIGISGPYTNWATGKSVISLAKTISDKNGAQYGIIVLDIDFSAISKYVETVHFLQDGYGILCDENFTVLAHPAEDAISKPLEEINIDKSNLVRGLLENPGESFSLPLVNYKGVAVISTARQIFNGWYIIIVTPIDTYYRDVNLMAVTLSILGILFMLGLSIIVIQLSYSKARSDEENLGKSTFLARMSHEIRTPMNSILGMAELIQRKKISDEIQEYIEIINQSGKNLLAIINDILDFSKIESGRLQIQKRNYQLASVINDMVNIIRPRIAEKSLDFLVNVESAIPAQLHGDDMRLRQILTNLLSNAVKYTRKGFISLEVGMEKTDEKTIKLFLAVRDSGIGIKSEDKDKLFNEFSRVDAEANRGIEGTGLGLVITRALCRAMGGDVTVASDYGKGSVFKAAVIQEYENDKPIASISDSKKKRVLFYDWRSEYVTSIKNSLENLGVDYEYTSEFQEFTKQLANGDFNYAFISSKYVLDCIAIPATREKPLNLAIMVEPGEISVYREVSSVLLPVYSVNIANVLNNVSGEVLYHDKILSIKFTAPSANILIVDDISTNLRVAKELMAPYNMNIQTCLSGPEAIQLVSNNKFDIVFMDHMMPGMDGIETTALIRSLNSADEYYQKLPIVALTANAVSGQKELFLEKGIDDFLAKPIEVQKLDEILEKWLPAGKLNKTEQLISGDETKPEKTETISIQGIDIEKGQRNCGGNFDIYLEILLEFCKDAENRLTKISDALAEGDTDLYVTLVHALKGAARNIGAVETGEKAFWLEKNGENGLSSEINEKTEELKADVITLAGNIKTEIDNYKAKTEAELEEVPELRLDVLKTALEEMDAEEINRMLITFAGLSLSSEVKAKISEVEEHILLFEYERAIDKINEML